MTTEAEMTTEPGDEGAWDLICRYTRAEALADGTLKDITETTRQAGIAIPVAVTEAVWRECVARTPAARLAGNDERGRTWDIAWMLRLNALRNADKGEFLFDVLVVTESVVPTQVTLKANLGPGDDDEPVITVLLPDED